MVIACIIGICLMSVIATIGAALLDNEKKWGVWFLGPAAWAAVAISFLFHNLSHWQRFHSRRSLLADPEGTIYAIPTWAAEAYISEKKLHYVSQRNAKSEREREVAASLQNCIGEWGQSFLVFGKPNVRYAPKKVWNEYEVVSKAEARVVVHQYKKRMETEST